MNVSYQIIWNPNTGTWVVASELAKGRRKQGKASLAIASLAVAGTIGDANAGGVDLESLQLHSRDTAFLAAGLHHALPLSESDGYATSQVDKTSTVNASATQLEDTQETSGRTSNESHGHQDPPSISLMGLVDGASAAGSNATAVGPQASATGREAIAVGYQASANGNQTIAIGSRAKAQGSSIALGDLADTGASIKAMAIGGNSKALGDYSIAFGDSASTSGIHTLAIGRNAKATIEASPLYPDISASIAIGLNAEAHRSIALGHSATAAHQDGYSNAAIGNSANATGTYNIALGTSARSGTSDGSASMASSLGYNAYSFGTRSTAIGAFARADGSRSIASGSQARAVTDDSVALGSNAVSSGLAGIAFGLNAASLKADAVGIGVNASADGTGSLALGNRSSTTGVDSTAVGGQSKATQTGSIAMGSYSSSEGLRSIAIGSARDANGNGIFDAEDWTRAGGEDAVAIGSTATAEGVHAMAFGYRARSTGATGSVAVGASSESKGISSVALGAHSQAVSTAAIAMGGYALSSGDSSVALGYGANSASAAGIAIGRSSSVTGDGSAALGNNAVAAHRSSVALGEGSVTAASNEVSIGNATLRRKITNVQEGTISATSTDGINGSQLFAATDVMTTQIANSEARVSGRINDLGKAMEATFGGNAAYDEATGTWTAPSFTVRGQTAGTVSEAFNLVESGFTKLEGDLTTVNNQVTGRMHELGYAVAGQLGGSVSYNETTGLLSAADYRVVNQSYADVDSAIEAVDGSLSNLQNQINNISGGGIDLVQRDATSGALTVAADHEVGSAASISFAGKDGAARRLGGVSDGVADDDAVNVSQLKSITDGGEVNLDNLGEQVASALGGTTAYDKTTNTWTKPSFAPIRGNDSRDNIHDALLDVEGGFADFDSRVGTIEGDITTINTSITTLATDVDNLGTQVAAGFGGTTAYDPATGNWTKPAFILDDGTNSNTNTAPIDNVSDALENLNARARNNTTNIAHNTTTINNLMDGTVGLVQRDATSGALTVAASHEVGSAASISFAGKDGATRRLTGISNGVADDDAVNMSQLKSITDGGEVNLDNLGEQVASALGGTTAYNKTTNTWTKPAFVLDDGSNTNTNTTIDNVNDALDNLNARAKTNTTSIANNTTTINSLTEGTVGLLQRDATSGALTVAAAYEVGPAASISFAGKNGVTRRLSGVSDGIADDDAVNVSQLESITGGVEASLDNLGEKIASALGGSATYDPVTNTWTKPGFDSIRGNASRDNVHQAFQDIEQGFRDQDNRITALSDNAVQYDSAAKDTVTLGGLGASTPVRLTNLAAGEISSASGDALNGSQLYGTAKSIADVFGGSARVESDGTIMNVKFNVGGTDYYTVDSAFTAIQTGFNTGTLGLVRQDQVTRTITVAQDTDGKVVSFKGGDGDRTLSDVAAGNLSSDSTEAVNGSQLHATNQRVDQLETKVTEIDGRVSNIEGDVTNIKNEISTGNVGLVKQDETSRVISVAGDRDGTEVNMAGTNGARKVTAVADGSIAQGSTDAVNGGQVHAVATTIADHIGGGARVNPDGTISAPTYSVGGQSHNSVGSAIGALDRRIDDWGYAMHGRIDDVERQAIKGIAAASAMMVSTPYAPGKTAINAGIAGYRGEAALGVGISRWSDNGRWNLNAGVSAAKGDEPVIRVGVGILLGD